MTKYTATFHPQVWINDNAMAVDPEGPTEWDVSSELDAMSSADLEKVLEDDNYESDDLRHSDNAPIWTA